MTQLAGTIFTDDTADWNYFSDDTADWNYFS